MPLLSFPDRKWLLVDCHLKNSEEKAVAGPGVGGCYIFAKFKPYGEILLSRYP